MARMIFVNLPVADLDRSIAFYRSIGAEQNLQFSDETAAAMVFSDTIHVMLLTHPKFAQFTPRPIAGRDTVEVLNCLSAERLRPSLLPRWLYEAMERGLIPALTRNSAKTDLSLV